MKYIVDIELFLHEQQLMIHNTFVFRSWLSEAYNTVESLIKATPDNMRTRHFAESQCTLSTN